VIAVAGGVGSLYLLGHLGLLPYGPHVTGALPLQHLSGSDDQPLVRIAAAWVPAGAVAGLALRAAGVSGRSRIVGTALVAALVLMATGAVSDAATVSGAISSHLTPQVSRAGTWVAVAFMVLGVAAVRGTGPGRSGASTGR
jgi:hypothetical protein